MRDQRLGISYIYYTTNFVLFQPYYINTDIRIEIFTFLWYNKNNKKELALPG